MRFACCDIFAYIRLWYKLNMFSNKPNLFTIILKCIFFGDMSNLLLALRQCCIKRVWYSLKACILAVRYLTAFFSSAHRSFSGVISSLAPCNALNFTFCNWNVSMHYYKRPETLPWFFLQTFSALLGPNKPAVLPGTSTSVKLVLSFVTLDERCVSKLRTCLTRIN